MTIAAGTPLRRVPAGPVIGVAVEYWLDVRCAWAALRVHVSEARESDTR